MKFKYVPRTLTDHHIGFPGVPKPSKIDSKSRSFKRYHFLTLFGVLNVVLNQYFVSMLRGTLASGTLVDSILRFLVERDKTEREREFVL